MKCIFSVDVEDWFHILDVPSTPPLSQWDTLPSRVEMNFMKLLDLFEEGNVSATCFFLGWVAQKYPHLVRAAQSRGHEIASHGYAHRLVYQMKPEEFLADAVLAKQVIEDAGSCEVIGYRASGFSVTQKTPWFFEQLAKANYRYDSSIFPAARSHGGFAGAEYAPHRVPAGRGELMEFPITLTKILNTSVCIFGGGYLRLAPWALIQRGAARVLGDGTPVVFYIHPREIDPNHPRLKMSRLRQFKSYVNLATTEEKVRRILSTFEFTTFAEYMTEHYRVADMPLTSSANGARQ